MVNSTSASRKSISRESIKSMVREYVGGVVFIETDNSVKQATFGGVRNGAFNFHNVTGVITDGDGERNYLKLSGDWEVIPDIAEFELGPDGFILRWTATQTGPAGQMYMEFKRPLTNLQYEVKAVMGVLAQISQVIQRRDISRQELAERMGISIVELEWILTGCGLTFDHVRRLCNALGADAQVNIVPVF